LTAKCRPELKRLDLAERRDKRTREGSVKYGKGRAGPVDGFYAHLRTLTHNYAHLRTLYADLRRIEFGLQQDSRRRAARLFQLVQDRSNFHTTFNRGQPQGIAPTISIILVGAIPCGCPF